MNLRKSSTRPALLATAWLTMLLLGPSAHAFIGEPETLVYGRILNRENPNLDQLVTSGQLRWTIRKADGSTIELSGDVDELDNGNYSYFVRIPHQAMMLGQQAEPNTLPLGTVAASASHMAITLDGGNATILPPSTSVFDLDQVLRASALRVDLEINAVSPDEDGDGIPDWWEDQHGLDRQDGGDALTDLNGNGLNNLGEYAAGTDPSADSTLPKLVTSEVIAYSGSRSLVLLETVDGNSTPAQLAYTLHAAPEAGRLMLRNAAALPAETAVELTAGATFTQADVLAGRLIYEHSAGETPGSFDIGVRDETPDHPESRGQVALRLFDPDDAIVAASAAESVRLEAKRLADEHGHLVADLGATSGRHRLSAATAGLSEAAYQTHVTTYGEEAPHVFLGGPADDTFTGGAAADFLYGSQGANTLAGGTGADTFIFTGTSSDQDTLPDFNPAQRDVIDLAGVLNGISTRLTDYVRLRRSGSDALMEISAAGTGTGFTDRVIRLQNSALQPADLLNLYYAGNLETGAIGMPPRLSLAAGTALASENGPVAGTFTITREGDLDLPLLVNLQVSGNATNGVDYQVISSSLAMPAGAANAVISILPYVDTTVEFNETVHIELGASASYLLDSGSTAQIVIEDLKPQISLEVIEGIAGVSDGTPAAVLIRRGGLVSPEVFVQFTLSGTAVNGTHYNRITAPYVTMAPGQTAKVVEFVPKASVNFGGAEAKTIRMTVQPDASFASMVPVANMVIVPQRLTYDEWLAANGQTASDAMLLMYGFGQGTEGTFDPSRMPKASVEEGHLTIRFRRKPGISDMDYRVEYSNDLEHWFNGPAVVEDVTSLFAPNDPAAAVFRSKEPMSAEQAATMRVKLLLDSETP